MSTTKDRIQLMFDKILEANEGEFPSDFVESLYDQFETRGTLSARQIECLEEIFEEC